MDPAKTPRLRGRPLQRLRASVFNAAGGLCAACSRQGRVKLAQELDHIQPLHKGGTDADSNLQPLCQECHARKTAADLGQSYRAPIGADGWPID